MDAGSVLRRCLIVDDNEGFLAAARSSLQREGLEIVGTATTSIDALEKARQLNPEIVLVDIALGRESGFELVRRLVDSCPDLRARVVLISTRGEEDFADMIAESPAAGFIPKIGLSAKAVRALLADAS